MSIGNTELTQNASEEIIELWNRRQLAISTCVYYGRYCRPVDIRSTGLLSSAHAMD